MTKQRQDLGTEVVTVAIDVAAARYGVGRSTLYAAMKAGDLPSIKLGKRRLLKCSEVEAWLDRHTTTGTTAAPVTEAGAA